MNVPSRSQTNCPPSLPAGHKKYRVMNRNKLHTLSITAASALGILLMSAPACSLISPVQTDVPIDFSWVAVSKAPVEAPRDMDSFAVWAWNTYGHTTTEVFSGEQIYWDSEARAWTYDHLRFWNEGTYIFHALHPYASGRTATCTSGAGFVLKEHTTGTGDTDLMVSTISRTYDPDDRETSAAVAFSFHHILSRIYLTASGDSDMTIDELRLSGVTITGDCTCSGTIPDEFTWTPTGAPDGTFAANSIPLTAGRKVSIFPSGLMLIPQSTSTLSLTAKLNGQPDPVTIPLPTTLTWHSGRSYTYDIPLSSTSTPTVSVTEADWTASDVTSDM